MNRGYKYPKIGDKIASVAVRIDQNNFYEYRWSVSDQTSLLP